MKNDEVFAVQILAGNQNIGNKMTANEGSTCTVGVSDLRNFDFQVETSNFPINGEKDSIFNFEKTFENLKFSCFDWNRVSTCVNVKET